MKFALNIHRISWQHLSITIGTVKRGQILIFCQIIDFLKMFYYFNRHFFSFSTIWSTNKMIVQIFLLVFEYVYSITGQETVITGRVDSEFRI